MENINSFIDNIPYLFQYIIYGYIFLSVFNFVSFKSQNENGEKLAYSIVTSFILNKIYDFLICKVEFFNNNLHPYRTPLIFVCLTVFLAALLGFVLRSRRLNEKLMDSLIGRSLNIDFWRDVWTDNTLFRIHVKDSNVIYEGQITYKEEFERKPYIQLENYIVISCETGKKIKDYDIYSKDRDSKINEEWSVLINLEDVDYIEKIIIHN